MPSLKVYRRALQAALDDGSVYLVSSSDATHVTLAAVSDSTVNASANRYDGAWLYHVRSAAVGQQRRVVAGGFIPATAILGVNIAWTVNPSVGDEVEITHLFPSGDDHPGLGEIASAEDTTYKKLLNSALGRIIAPDRVGTAITTAQFYSTVAWSWLDRPERLLDVLEPGVRGGLERSAMWRGCRLRLNAETPGIEVPARFRSASGTLSLDVLRPADTWIAVSGVWGESTAGLAFDDDEAVPSVNDVVTVALVEAYQALMNRSPGRPNGNWAAKFKDAVIEARRVRWYDQTQESPAAKAIASPAEAAA